MYAQVYIVPYMYMYITIYMSTAESDVLHVIYTTHACTFLCHRNVSLKQKVKALKKKEAEETKALEEMVLKVESNLQTTTVRKRQL